jgi:hypothetical protein
VKEILVKGQPRPVQCVQIAGQWFQYEPGLVTTLRLEDDWFTEIEDPEAVIGALRRGEVPVADVLTFGHRLPDVAPRHQYPMEHEMVAALRLDSYEHWWTTQIRNTTRNMIRKSQKAGVVVRECAFDERFVSGMAAIFNEAPSRQGRAFWHYGKDAETVRRQFSRNLHREDLIGAYLDEEMIGFAMLGRGKRFADVGQILAKLSHRDKAVPNALLAKCVEISARRGLEFLVYGYWSDSSLGQFKRQSGFESVPLPRYHVPLTFRGRLAVAAGLTGGLRQLIPASVADRLKQWRSRWYSRGQALR